MYVLCVITHSCGLACFCACHCVGGRGGDETDGPPKGSEKTKRPLPEGRCVHV